MILRDWFKFQILILIVKRKVKNVFVFLQNVFLYMFKLDYGTQPCLMQKRTDDDLGDIGKLTEFSTLNVNELNSRK